VLYVSALVDRDGEVLAFYGEGDAHTGVAVFDRRELAEELRRSPFERMDSIRLRLEGTSIGDAFRGMQALREFSERRQHPRIRIVVTAPQLRATIEHLALPNMIVHPDEASVGSCDGTLVGATGTLTWTRLID